ncbi:hypothetical protein SEVIR_3G295900v4 [Setaria viridis]|uniref:Mixed lineage kinase domain-containing protein n=2 Tax=Setaria TaxID=4554 RepID=K3ZDR9_SETIT|nr:hypothetical protein SETIT_3G288100v2 [Setaria italica]TKW28011.1 hypothetical protein SEVIR_3G295900v2 [Setaria viridis]
MEPLSNVRTIVGIAQDILAAVETASRNKTRCGRVARRVRRLRDVLELDGAEAGTTTDAAMRSLLEELEEALCRALQQVRRCQRTGFLRALVVAGGRMADPLDEVERDIDRCVQDLGLASYVRIARLEKRLRQQSVAASSSDDEVATASVPDDNKADRSGAEKDDEEDATAAEDVTATGVPLRMVAAGMREHGHEIVMLPSHGHAHGYCYWHFSHGHATGTCDCWHYYAGCPSDAASYYIQYSPYPSIFSDDNPNACSII